jgi:uncharacterized membrane protein YkoI
MGRISDDSPVGRALHGHRAGDVVTVMAPAGAIQPALSEGSEQPEYVSPTDAMEAALSHAGYRQHETTDMKVELEIDKNKVVYDVEFWAEGYDYDYKVDAQSGLVLMVEKDRG